MTEQDQIAVAIAVVRLVEFIILWLALVGIAQWLRDLYHAHRAILAALERMGKKDEVAK